MEGRASDFSIDRILSPQLGPRPPVDHPQGVQHMDSGIPRPPAPFQVPVMPDCPPYRGMNFGEAFFGRGAGLHHSDLNIYSNAGVCVHINNQDSAGAQRFPGYHGYQQPGMSMQSQQRQKSRMRTVFTDSQARRLEELFASKDYPPVEARAEVARSTGLSEETVRVWFKNRRARRKRKRSESKAKPAPPPSDADGGDR